MCSVRSGVLLIICLIYVTSFCNAFDGNRKGFVVGVGTGFSPLIGWSSNPGSNQLKIGGSFNFFIGYGLDNKNILALEANRSISSYGSHNNSRILVSNGIRGLNWYHYFNEKYTSWYAMCGVGDYHSAEADYDINGKLGFIAGAGFGLNKSFKTGLYISGTRAHQGTDKETTITCYQVSLSIVYLAY
ncbi:MAG: hypothetical protein R3F48_03585 [Candidatus Zixiibacteriota bacterium]